MTHVLWKVEYIKRNFNLWNDAMVDEKKGITGEKIAGVLVAFLLLIAHYEGVFGEPLSTVFLILWAPIILIQLVAYRNLKITPVIPIVIFVFFSILNHGTDFSEFFRSLLILLYVLATVNGLINFRIFLKTILFISILATVCLFIQYIGYYILGVHINFIPTFLLNDFMLNQTRELVLSPTLNGFYRPSAFFTEPSHLAQYVSPLLFYLLLSPSMSKVKIEYALLISCGILLSTSGVGAITIIGLWSAFIFFNFFHNNIKLLGVGLGLVSIFLLLFIILFMNVEFFRETILRLFGESALSPYSATSGRTSGGKFLISTFNKHDLIFGLGEYEEIPGYYISGVFSVIATNGIVGLILYMLTFLQHIIFLRRDFKLLGIFCVILLIYWNSFALQYIIYFSVFLFSGYAQLKNQKTKRGEYV